MLQFCSSCQLHFSLFHQSFDQENFSFQALIQLFSVLKLCFPGLFAGVVFLCFPLHLYVSEIYQQHNETSS